MKKAVVLLSGGLDSLAAMAVVLERGTICVPLFFDYGQPCVVEEKSAAQAICKHYSAVLATGLNCITIEKLGNPEGFVPGRNAIFMTHAAILAWKNDISGIVMGFQWGEPGEPVHPDASVSFGALMCAALSEGFGTRFEVDMPLSGFSKRDVILEAEALQAPVHLTWSCYRSGASPCGQCTACVSRRKGFHKAGIVDRVSARFW